jgi:lysophospholipase L1-like esterase
MRTLTAGLLLALICSSPASAGPIYLALGDSSAFGETNRTRNPSNGDRGYVAPFADYLAHNGPNAGTRPEVVNLAIDGETSSSYFSGTGRVSADGQGFNTNYAGLPVPTAQQDRMHELLGSPDQAARVKTITVQFGANNLDAVASAPDFLTVSNAERQSRILAAYGQLTTDYVGILTDLKTRFPDADVYMMGYHNPYNGDPSHPFYPLADPAVKGLNQVIWGLSEEFGAKYVDVYGITHPNEKYRTYIDTWRDDPVNYVHLNDRGYSAVASALIQEAGGPLATPEPATIVLAAVGGLVALGGRLRRRNSLAA